MATEKACPKCGQTKTATEFYTNNGHQDRLSSACRVCTKKYNDWRYGAVLKGQPGYKERVSETNRLWHLRNKKRNNERARFARRQDREQAIAFYGGRCACCQEDRFEFLAMDHINGGGTAHRKEHRGHIERWLVANGFPEGFRVLCHNCNLARGYYGYCPHKTAEGLFVL